MAFTMCPDNGPPRIFRRSNEVPDDLICILDRDQNILLINPKNFDALTPTEQAMVRRTTRARIHVGDVINHPRFHPRFQPKRDYREAAE